MRETEQAQRKNVLTGIAGLGALAALGSVAFIESYHAPMDETYLSVTLGAGEIARLSDKEVLTLGAGALGAAISIGSIVSAVESKQRKR